MKITNMRWKLRAVNVWSDADQLHVVNVYLLSVVVWEWTWWLLTGWDGLSISKDPEEEETTGSEITWLMFQDSRTCRGGGGFLRLSRISVMPALSASSSILNLASSWSSLRRWRSTWWTQTHWTQDLLNISHSVTFRTITVNPVESGPLVLLDWNTAAVNVLTIIKCLTATWWLLSWITARCRPVLCLLSAASRPAVITVHLFYFSEKHLTATHTQSASFISKLIIYYSYWFTLV